MGDEATKTDEAGSRAAAKPAHPEVAAAEKRTLLLSLLFLCSSGVTAFCLAILAFTFATGDLPFGIEPIIPEPEEEPPAEAVIAEKTPKSRQEAELVPRAAESYAVSLFQEVENERKKLASERELLAEQKRVIEQMMELARKQQDEVVRAEQKLKELVTVIDATEMQSVKRLAEIVSAGDDKSGATMLLEMDEPMAARVLYCVEPKKAASLLAEAFKLAGADEKQTAQIVSITRNLHKLTDKVNL